MGFLFTEENQNLKKLKDDWIAGDSFGAYVLVGKSGSGKTAFLQHLDKEWKNVARKEMITWMRVEELVTALLGEEDVFINVQTPVLVMENMEELIDKDSTLYVFWSMLEEWLCNDKHLFIGVSNNERIVVPTDVNVVQNQEIKITPMVVSYVATMQDIHLSEQRIKKLCIEADGSISRLIGLLKRECLLV